MFQHFHISNHMHPINFLGFPTNTLSLTGIRFSLIGLTKLQAYTPLW